MSSYFSCLAADFLCLAGAFILGAGAAGVSGGGVGIGARRPILKRSPQIGSSSPFGGGGDGVRGFGMSVSLIGHHHSAPAWRDSRPLRRLNYLNARLACQAHHARRAAPAREGDHEVRFSLGEHLLIADRAG